jgi:hypothetical protein
VSLTTDLEPVTKRRPVVRPLTDYPRVQHDFYVESVWAAAALFKIERFAGETYDPACGTGTIVEAARAAGLPAWGSDLVHRGYDSRSGIDFTLEVHAQHRCNVENVVSNPPFRLARRFVENALLRARLKVAMLLPLAFLEGDERSRWLETTSLARVWVSRSRVGMRPGGQELASDGGTKAYAWFVWEHGWCGPAQVRWFDKPKPATAA